MNRQTPLMLAVIFLAFVLAHGTAIAGSLHGGTTVTGTGGYATMHSGHAPATVHQHTRHSPADQCDPSPAIVDDDCVTIASANSLRLDGDPGVVPDDVGAIIRQRDPHLKWTALGNVHTILGSARRALLQVYLN